MALTVRPPHFAGRHYFADEGRLQALVMSQIEDAHPPKLGGELRGLIVPHGPHLESGAIAGFAYKLLLNVPQTWPRVTLLAPTTANASAPLIDPRDVYDVVVGLAHVDLEARDELLSRGGVIAAPDDEPVIEAQLQYALIALGDVSALPLRLPLDVAARDVAALGDERDLIVVAANLPAGSEKRVADAIVNNSFGALFAASDGRRWFGKPAPPLPMTPDLRAIECGLACAQRRGANAAVALKQVGVHAAFALIERRA